MKIELIFDNEGQRVELRPETDREKLLLGSALQGRIESDVMTRYEGHPTHNRAVLVSIELRPVPPTTPGEFD